MSIISLPVRASYTRTNQVAKAYNSTNIAVSYRDVGSSTSTTATATLNSLKTDLTQGYDEQILTGSVRFKAGNDTFIDRNSTLYRNVDPATGSGTSSGSIQYGTGVVDITSWTANATNAFILQSLVTTTDMPRINRVSFRVPIIPVRPSSLTIVAASLSSGTITLTSDSSGILTASNAIGKINYETGFVSIYYYTKTEITVGNRATIEAYDWYNVDLEYTEGGTTYINIPEWIDPTSITYSCVCYSYLPLDATILGLDPVRLPTDGRVPIIRKGNVVVIHDTKTTSIPSPAASTTYNSGRTLLAYAKLYDSAGTVVDTDLYSANLTAGTIMLSPTFTVGSLVLPLSFEHRIEDIAVATDVQINGTVQLNRPITHNYTAGEAHVSSALIIGGMQARAYNLFDQTTWTNEWSDQLIGSATAAQYNNILYPIIVTNAGAIQERWALIFISPTAFRIIGEKSGQIGMGDTGAVCNPINPVSSTPYFTIPAEGWGSGWAAGNVLRFNTDAANFPIWVARTVQQGTTTTTDDSFQIQIRVDVDNP